MDLHTNTLTYADVTEAAKRADVQFSQIGKLGSRRAAHKFTITLTGNSRRRPNSGRGGAGDSDAYAATWDQWGQFLAYLYGIDPDMWTRSYADVWEFQEATAYRFDDDGSAPDDAHGDHKFKYSHPGVLKCTKCTAEQRRV